MFELEKENDISCFRLVVNFFSSDGLVYKICPFIKTPGCISNYVTVTINNL